MAYFSVILFLIFEYIILTLIVSRLQFLKYIKLIYIYPVFKLCLFYFYIDSWTNLGDYHSYVGRFHDLFAENRITILDILEILTNNNPHDRLYILAAVNIVAPSLFMQGTVLLIANDFCYLILLYILILLYKNVLSLEHLGIGVFFLLFSPTYLSLFSLPDRHIFTLFALLLFGRDIMYHEKFNSHQYVWLLGVLILLLNKPQLLLIALPTFLLLVNPILWKKYLFIMLPIFFLLVFSFKSTIMFYINNMLTYSIGYANIVKTSMGSSYILFVPIIKYVYGILSPFPWYNYYAFVDTYGSFVTPILFFLNSLIGLTLFFNIFIFKKKIIKKLEGYSKFLVFGLISSMSIIFGHIGHSGYLSIYFIFFLPIVIVVDFKRLIITFMYMSVLLLGMQVFLFIMEKFI